MSNGTTTTVSINTDTGVVEFFEIEGAESVGIRQGTDFYTEIDKHDLRQAFDVLGMLEWFETAKIEEK